MADVDEPELEARQAAPLPVLTVQPDQQTAGASASEGSVAAPILSSDARRISFQAILTDGDGVPLAGPTVNLAFNLWRGAVLVEGPIGIPNVPVNNGVVDVQVPVSASSFDGTARQLGVVVNPPGSEMSPRLPLSAVPYAFRVNRVASEELDDVIELGTVRMTTHGRLQTAESQESLMEGSK